MAPKSQDDRQGDDVTRRSDAAAPDKPERGRETSRSGRRENDPVDFGAFVSRSVRSSADRFKQGFKESAAPDEAPGEEPAPRRSSSRASTRKERPARYWRDSLREHTGDDAEAPGSRSQRFLGQTGDQPEPGENDDGGNGGGIGGWWQSIAGGDGEGPNRSMIGYFLLGLVLMLLVIFLLVKAFGGDDGSNKESPETPVPTQIVAPESGPGVTPQPTSPGTEPLEPTQTPEVQRGGDNQLGGDRDGTPGARGEDGDLALGLTPVSESPLARQCPDRCLVRVESNETGNILGKTGNRPSFVAEDMAWVVATHTQISLLDERADVELIQDSDETLHLYAVTVPDGEDPALVEEYGDVLDKVGSYRLVEFEDIPARVSTLVNKGYNINKVAPAPPRDPVHFTDKPRVGDISPGVLMGQVSDANVVADITDLQASGSTDGTGIGTRYYTYPGNQIAADYLYQRLESYGLSVWYEDFLTPEGILLVNVVAEAPGEDDSAVYAVMSHLDSINVEESPASAPGADDNSTGMAINLEMARILVQYELEHPVRFVFVNAEEVGIIGSSVWAKKANADGVAMDGVFNVDSVGSDRQGRLIVLNSDENSAWLQDILISVNDDYGLNQNIESRESTEIVADDNMVRDEGIDAVMIARELYGWSPLHHSTRDVVEKVSIDNTLTTAYMVMLAVVRLVQ